MKYYCKLQPYFPKYIGENTATYDLHVQVVYRNTVSLNRHLHYYCRVKFVVLAYYIQEIFTRKVQTCENVGNNGLDYLILSMQQLKFSLCSHQLARNDGTLFPVLCLCVPPVARIIFHSVICLCLFILSFSERSTGKYCFHLAPSDIPLLQQIRLKLRGEKQPKLFENWTNVKP
jgi:hypothetical protein